MTWMGAGPMRRVVGKSDSLTYLRAIFMFVYKRWIRRGNELGLELCYLDIRRI